MNQIAHVCAVLTDLDKTSGPLFYKFFGILNASIIQAELCSRPDESFNCSCSLLL